MNPDVTAAPWRRFALSFALAALVLMGALYGFVLSSWTRMACGLPRPNPPTPIMDVNQRFMYPQLIRSGRFDLAVFGTSTVRLLGPPATGSLPSAGISPISA